MIPVDFRQVEDAILTFGMMRGDVKPRGHAGLGIDAIRHVAAQLEREHAGDVGRPRQRLQVEYQLHVLVVRIGDADRRSRQLAPLAAAVVGLDLLDAPFDLADVFEMAVEPCAIGAAQRRLQLRG